MSDMKCPFCNGELERVYSRPFQLICGKCGSLGTDELWKELIRTRKALETLQEFVTKLYLNGNITDEQLERYKKMLIIALEQKDK